MNFERVRNLKKHHTIISLIIFSFMIAYGIIKIDLLISSTTLSNFGIREETNPFWIISLIILSASIWSNSYKYNRVISTLFRISVFGLVGVAFVDMDFSIILHDIFAGIFFLFYSLSIFVSGISLMKTDFRIAMTSIFISILMMISILFLGVKLQSISEIIFFILSFLWNFIIIYTMEIKKILKYIGL